jgi:O-antigen/teichoic acid export membrane protein
MLGFSLPLLPGELAELLVRFVDRYLVVHLASLAAAGVYFLGSRFGNLLHAALIAPFSQIFVIRRLAAFGDGAADPEGPRVYTYFFMVAATGAVGLSILAPEIVAVLAPASYEGARRVAPLFALNELILSLIFIVELGIYYAKRPLRLTAATLSTLTVHVALNLVLIPILGILGAALGSCLSSALRVALTVYLGRRFAGPRPEWLRIGVILALAIAMGMAGQALEAVPGPVGVLLRIALIPSLPLLLVASPLFGSADRAILREALGTLPGMRGRGEPRH